MKRIVSFSLAIIVFTLSIVLCLPDITFADDATTLSKSKDNPFGYSSSEAQSYVSAHKDIYDSDHILLFSYTPTNTYNWTYSQVGKNSLHLSDNQLVAFLMSKKTITAYASMFVSVLSNNNVTRGLLSSVGIATTGDSDSLVNVMDKLTGNYNYLDSLNYDEESQTVTMSNVNGSVDKLREEIKEYYYYSVGIRFLHSSGDIKKAISTSYYDDMDLYTEDFKMLTDYDYAIFSKRWKVLFAFNKSDFNYLYFTQKFYNNDSSSNDVTIRNVDKNLDDSDLNISSSFNITPDNFSPYTIKSLGCFITYYKPELPSGLYFTNVAFDGVFGSDSSPDYFAAECYLYSKNDEDIMIFASYEALYNYLKSDQNAYLSKTINETGKDISYSIKDMDENLGSKIDQLIDTINDKKGSMTQEELQDAIDKGIKDLQKTTEDIKDNTSSILDKLEEQNQILLQILGVTEYIAYNTQKDDGTDYTVSDLKNVFNTMYNGLGNAILYGKNTVTDSGTSSGNVQKASFSVSGAASGASNDYVAVAAYSLDDDVGADDAAAQDINNMDIHDGLFGKFPFSVPYQLYEWLQVLEADPVAPVFNYNYGFLLGKKDDPKCNIKIDLSIYEPWANMAKSFQRLAFTLLIAVFIFHKFNGNTKGGNLS